MEHETWAHLEAAAEAGEVEMRSLVKAVNMFGASTGTVVQKVENALVGSKGVLDVYVR
jgi:hypothetical protein